jgi:hypothetical protein
MTFGFVLDWDKLHTELTNQLKQAESPLVTSA